MIKLLGKDIIYYIANKLRNWRDIRAFLLIYCIETKRKIEAAKCSAADACRRGDLISFRFNFWRGDYNLTKCMYLAAKFKNLAILEFIEAAGVMSWYTAYKGACASGNYELYRYFRKKINGSYLHGLRDACIGGNAAIVKELLNGKVLDGLKGAAKANNMKCFRFLQKWAVEKKIEIKYTGLLPFACRGGNYDLVCEIFNKAKWTSANMIRAFDKAIKAGNEQILMFLYEKYGVMTVPQIISAIYAHQQHGLLNNIFIRNMPKRDIKLRILEGACRAGDQTFIHETKLPYDVKNIRRALCVAGNIKNCQILNIVDGFIDSDIKVAIKKGNLRFLRKLNINEIKTARFFGVGCEIQNAKFMSECARTLTSIKKHIVVCGNCGKKIAEHELIY